jgi:hypothetical protein
MQLSLFNNQRTHPYRVYFLVGKPKVDFYINY